MKLKALHARLGDLIDQGYGDRYVIDDWGNDVAAVAPPEANPGEVDEGDERLDVMLNSRVDRKDAE